jgi:spore maturation protein CgeB
MAALRVAIDRQGKEIVIVSELGDEPQTKGLNAVRAQLSDLCITPDVECASFWSNLGCDAHWLTHWADEEIFYRNQSCVKKTLVATTVGKRKYVSMLRLLFGRVFINRTCNGVENNTFYNSALIAFQYARWGEVTRRIFEAGACGCCVFTNRLNHKKCLEDIFEDDKSIVLYRHRLDLILKLIKYLYFMPAEAKRIGNHAATVIQRHHTASARARQLFNIIQRRLSSDAPVHIH